MSDSESGEEEESGARPQVEEEGSEEEEEEAPAPSGGGKAAKVELEEDEDEDEDEDSEDDDEEDDEDDQKGKSGGKKRKKARGSKYIDDAAGEDDSEEEDGPSNKRRKGDGYDDEDDAEMDEATQDRLMNENMNRHRRLDFLEMDEQQISDRFKADRYADDEEEDAAGGEHRQMALLPDATKDPKVWSVRVANGSERTIVLQLMCKFVQLGKEKKPINITSAYCNEHALGFIYIEARKEAFVREAISGLRGVYGTKMKLVPVGEMQATVTISKKNIAAEEGGWARCRRGKYKGDIVQVMSTDPARNEVEVRLVPRVDTSDYSSFDEAEAKKRRSKAVPPRRLFDPANHNEKDLERWVIDSARSSEGQLIYEYEGMVFETKEGDANTGFLVKKMTTKSLQLGSDVQPELDELKMFEQATAGDDEKPVKTLTHMTSIHKRRIVLIKGDVVRVKDGELRDLLGDVDSINGNQIVIRPRHDLITQKLSFKMEEVEKYFEQGDHVKAEDAEEGEKLLEAGRTAGVTGTVVRVEGEIITVLTDVNHEEVRVFSADLQDTTEVSTGLDVVGQFQLHDLILLEAATASLAMPSVGVVIKLEKDALQVLDNHGKVRAVRPADAQPQKRSQTAVALDGEQQTVGQGDIVKVTDGQMKGKTGTVRHVFRAFLFLHSPSRMENGGIFVVRSRQCALMGQSKHTENAAPNQGPPGPFGQMGTGGGPGG
eukprot:CAMPEP_0180384472 /NCGR_PEP_ID=MMETSP0989-20121125/28552_1 /TAXON_ID=697907 /ORGANISM="non described non described, Strain CCMP2293" /LENGTH=714 /DNA_ID=CAMNT_0022384927 /DNA_START=139 /DNA_END=2280 /DNA_ORIENTATION=-